MTTLRKRLLNRIELDLGLIHEAKQEADWYWRLFKMGGETNVEHVKRVLGCMNRVEFLEDEIRWINDMLDDDAK